MKSLKFLSSKEMNKIAKSALALVIAGTFTFSAATAFANENKEDADFETVEIKNDLSAESTENAKEKLDENESEAPSLLPGSFFYFAKLALEKVKLALTFDDIKDAKLLAGYAAERMAEAEALLAEGKEEEALEAIEKALEQMENADTIVDEANEDQEKSKPGEEDNGNLISESELAEDADPAEDPADNVDISDNGTLEKEPEDEVKEALAQNIIALQANFAKFSERFDENHPAILAMQKNIAKFSEKWSEQVIDEKESGQAAEIAPAPIKSEDASSGTETAENPEKKIDKSAPEETNVLPEVSVKVSKEAKDAAKAENKKAHEEAKVIEAQKRAEAKAAREEARKAEKGAREAAKQAEKEAREAAGKAAKEQQVKKIQEKQAEAKRHAGKGKEKAEAAKGQGKENKDN
ncbi:DUF5667 domain-containing protein [Bacillus sp. NTK034]|uniref:DUF5667 domain-containing protein n=1 Tax=Bacillus sp. NTK034 TaxID=2802176 RepID=UPI0028A97E52|nr:DUF5667 domain-containing protein [Bacillus sp. NTK034]